MSDDSDLDEDDMDGSLSSDNDNLYTSGDEEDRVRERLVKKHVGRVSDVIRKA